MKTTTLIPFLILLCISLFPAYFIEFYPGFFLDATAGVAGFVGIGILFLQPIIGHRLISSIYTKDILDINKFHKFTGIYGTLIIFLHPLLLIDTYGLAHLFFEIPDFSEDHDIYLALGKLAFFLLIIVWISSGILRSKIQYRPWKYIHYLGYIAFYPATIHALNSGSSTTSEPVLQNYIYILIALYTLFLTLRILFAVGVMKKTMKVLSVKKVTDNTFIYEIQKPKIFNYKHGQYIYIMLNRFGEEHPFTIVKTTGESFFIATKIEGKFTKQLKALEAGDKVFIDGPYGVFTKQLEDDKADVFLAGGIGVTPFIDGIEKYDYGFISCRNLEDIPFKSDLHKNEKRLHIFHTGKNKPPKSLEGIDIINRRVDHRDLEKIKDKYGDARYYICGPHGFIQAMKKCLTKLGINENQIHTEEFTM